MAGRERSVILASWAAWGWGSPGCFVLDSLGDGVEWENEKVKLLSGNLVIDPQLGRTIGELIHTYDPFDKIV